MIRITSLTKDYGTLRALDHLDLHVDDGEIVGFVGANGAGKSTTMRIIMGSLISDEGEVLWVKDGQQVPMDAYHRRLVGYMPEERGLYPKMKVADQLTYLARLHGLSRHEATSAANGWMERLAVGQRAGDEVQKLSLGNQQRVQLAAALVSDPELLVLDEPFSGLDPVAVDVMSEVLRERAQAGVGTLFSSHQLDVVERLCDRVVIIRSGKLVADGTVAELQASAGLRWQATITPSAGVPARALEGLEDARTQSHADGRVTVSAGGPSEQPLLEAVRPLGTLHQLGPVRHSLTEIFREVLAAPAAGTPADPAPTAPATKEDRA
ncbi:ABC transporter ATP-binding protein [Actinomyces sp. oral taxon 897]|uniref:ABC transporter ATP-binding protein n=1 Tax=Actinomyces sp. oral taxon 897 TaxID=2081702 RepID=UPI000D042E1B|nr:ATP-binding cassette domain-containing protein [Actinomyces sp. oral taxon 897]AVM62675.1 ABC transporter ATP-binding protein [Actinomyces sp. oral taxon 897]